MHKHYSIMIFNNTIHSQKNSSILVRNVETSLHFDFLTAFTSKENTIPTLASLLEQTKQLFLLLKMKWSERKTEKERKKKKGLFLHFVPLCWIK